jgi:CNT family concentrative nucleoside transporter
VIDAAASGAADGMRLVLNVAAMLLAFVALVALANFVLNWGGVKFGVEGLTIERILQYAFAPLPFLMGVEHADVLAVSGLLGEKMVLTEFIAFGHLGQMDGQLSERSFMMASYALCGFANFASIAIQIGGIGAMAPGRRSDLAKFGLKAMLAGFLTTCVTAAVAGIVA